jgi:hypothetical protein
MHSFDHCLSHTASPSLSRTPSPAPPCHAAPTLLSAHFRAAEDEARTKAGVRVSVGAGMGVSSGAGARMWVAEGLWETLGWELVQAWDQGAGRG